MGALSPGERGDRKAEGAPRSVCRGGEGFLGGLGPFEGPASLSPGFAGGYLLVRNVSLVPAPARF